MTLTANNPHYGVVIKKFSHADNYFQVFDKTLGAIGIYCYAKTPHEGTMMQYQMSKNSRGYRIKQYDIITYPPITSPQQLLFLHHVLEICYFFIPVNSSCTRIFPLLDALYTCPFQYAHKKNQLLYILKLIVTIGIHDQYTTPSLPLDYSTILYTPLDQLIHLELSYNDLLEIHHWLYFCFKRHPYVKYFKTIIFFSETMS